MKKNTGLPRHNTPAYAKATADKARNDRQRGFTLIEILITTVLVFLLLTLIYATFFSISTVTAELQNKMKSSEIIFKFLNKFNEEIKCMICEKDDEATFFSRKELTFITKDRTMPYPVKITYFVELSADNKETLFRRQENLIDGYSFVLPVLKETGGIDFLFYDGEYWDYAKEVEKVIAVAVETDYAGEKMFFPVKIYRDKPDEKKQ